MTYRLAILGNSHNVAMRDGWELLTSEKESFEATFFTAPNDEFVNFRLENRRLIPTTMTTTRHFMLTSNQATHVPLDDFDGYLLVGMFASIRRVVDMYRDHRLVAHTDSDVMPISEPAFRSAVHGRIKDTAAFRVAGQLRQTTDKPIVMLPEPHPFGDMRENETNARWSGDYMPFLNRVFAETMVNLAAEFEATFVPQAADMVEAPCFTPRLYSVGSQNIWGKAYDGSKVDYFHMNGAYGARMLARALPAFHTAPVKLSTEYTAG